MLAFNGSAIIVVGALASVLGAGLIANPIWTTQVIGANPVFNCLLFAYGLPALIFAVVAWRFHTTGQPIEAHAANALALFVGVCATGMLVHHGFHGDHMSSAVSSIYEYASFATVWMTLGVLLVGASRWFARETLGGAGAVLFTLGVIAYVLGPCLFANPLWTTQAIGTLPIFNGLLFAFALPVVMLSIAACLYNSLGMTALRNTAIAIASAALLLHVGLEVHHGFHRENMSAAVTSVYEWATLGVAWTVIGIAMLGVAQWRKADAAGRVGSLVIALGGVISVFGTCLVANPLFVHQNLGALPVLNGLLYIYGAPMLLCAVAAWLYHHSEKRVARDVALQVCIAWAYLLTGMEVQQGFHLPAMNVLETSLVQLATHAIVWAVLAVGLLLASQKYGVKWLYRAGVVGLALFAVTMILGVGIVENPLWNPTDVGSLKIVDWLLYAYALPAGIAALVAWTMKRSEGEGLSRFFGGMALVLAFAYVSLEVRHWFQGAFLDHDGVLPFELYAYSAVWIAFGIFLVTLGIYTRSKAIRIASMVVMLAAMSKVFIYDTRHLEDMLRVFSYMGLGASLLGLFWAYRKWVFPPLDAGTGSAQEQHEA